jgi:hypothetical protein
MPAARPYIDALGVALGMVMGVASSLGCALPLRVGSPETADEVFSTTVVASGRIESAIGYSDRSASTWILECVPDEGAGGSVRYWLLIGRPGTEALKDHKGRLFAVTEAAHASCRVTLTRRDLEVARVSGLRLSTDERIWVDVPAYFVRGFLRKVDAQLSAEP